MVTETPLSIKDFYEFHNELSATHVILSPAGSNIRKYRGMPKFLDRLVTGWVLKSLRISIGSLGS
jgi:hypothetical protein